MPHGSATIRVERLVPVKSIRNKLQGFSLSRREVSAKGTVSIRRSGMFKKEFWRRGPSCSNN